MPMTPREMIKHLKKNGFEGLEQAILKQAGLK